jgi:cytochrome c553
VDHAASVVGEHPGVSHNYRRDHAYNLWYTLAVPPNSRLGLDGTIERLHQLSNAVVTRKMETLRLFKIGVRLDVKGERSADSRGAVAAYDEEDQEQARSYPLTQTDIRAIREGVHKSGRPLVIMPSMAFNKMSDEDAHSIVAYLRSQPAVEDTAPKSKLNALGAIMVGAGMLPPEVIAAQPPVTGPVTAPPQGTPEHGDYLASVLGCRDCHGPALSGGIDPEGNLAPNLTVLVPNWTEAQFAQTIRTGTDPSGHAMNPEIMPWKSYAKALTDDELQDLYGYMSKLPPLSQGQTP